MRKFFHLFIITLLSLSLIACSNKEKINTSKGSDGIATIEKYTKIKQGMTYEEVKAIFGGDGDLVTEDGVEGSENNKQLYAWKGSKSKSMAQITFLNGKVRSQAQQNLD